MRGSSLGFKFRVPAWSASKGLQGQVFEAIWAFYARLA